jgi:hypothetical protein
LSESVHVVPRLIQRTLRRGVLVFLLSCTGPRSEQEGVRFCRCPVWIEQDGLVVN